MTFNRSEIEKEVFAAIATVAGVETVTVKADTDLSIDLNLDSLALYELVVELEERYGLRISDEDLDRIHTAADVIVYIEKHVKT